MMEYAGRNGTIDASLWDRLPPELYAGIQKHMPQGRPVYGIIKRMMQDNDAVFDSTAPVGDACPYRERFDAITPLQSPKGLEITGISFQFVVDRDNFHEEFGMWPPHADDNESDIHGVLQYTTLCCDMDLADNEALPHVIKPVPGQRFPLRFEDGDVRTALLQFLELVDSSRTWLVNDCIRFEDKYSPMHAWTREEKVGFAKCVRMYINPFLRWYKYNQDPEALGLGDPLFDRNECRRYPPFVVRVTRLRCRVAQPAKK